MATLRFLTRALRFRSPPSIPRLPIRAPHHQPGLFASLPAHPSSQLTQRFLTHRLYSSSSSSSSPSPTTPSTTPTDPTAIPARFQGVPHYQLSFTCKPCSTRSTHRVSHQGYHKGTVLITCPACKARHLMADHLKIFSDTSKTIEDILRDKNEGVVRGTVGEEMSKGEEVGDIEFWRREEAKGLEGEGEGEGDVKSIA